MIAKYNPSGGWYLWPSEVIERFFDEHHHVSQWGNGFSLEFEIQPDFPTDPPVVHSVAAEPLFVRAPDPKPDSEPQ
jgi:hypothetical protein